MTFGKVVCVLMLLSACHSSPNDYNSKLIATPNVYLKLNSDLISRSGDTIYRHGQLYSGFLFQTFANSNDTEILLAYSNGLQSGCQKKWYSKGVLMESRYYVNGKKHDQQLAYWENGHKKFEFNAIDDAYEGELKEWNIEGDLIHLAHFKNGQEEGVQKLFYDNGKIRANYVIKNGRRYGLLGTKNCRNVSDSIFNVK